jgi:hypothetical protein
MEKAMLLDNPKLEVYRATEFTVDHPDYAAAREVALADIELMDRLHAEAVRAPQFISVETGDGEIDIVESDEPWERLDIAVQRVARNVNAFPLLVRQDL